VTQEFLSDGCHLGASDFDFDRGAILVPVKAFHEAKERLAPALNAMERALLARTLAEGVIRAAAPLTVAVVCDDHGVAEWAGDQGAIVVWAPGRGLNLAVASGVGHLEAMGYQWITVAHGDLPLAAHLNALDPFEGVTIVPDRRRDGTNVIRLPRGSGFNFSYGPRSFDRHVAETARLGLELSIVEDLELSIDIDIPDDLTSTRAWTRQWGPEGPH
jgi:2-phospho-L-lactate guanylyltransferase